jgi:hypothetical protein
MRARRVGLCVRVGTSRCLVRVRSRVLPTQRNKIYMGLGAIASQQPDWEIFAFWNVRRRLWRGDPIFNAAPGPLQLPKLPVIGNAFPTPGESVLVLRVQVITYY